MATEEIKVQKPVTISPAQQPEVSVTPAVKKSEPIPIVNKNKQHSEVSDTLGKSSAAKSLQPEKAAGTQQINSTILEQELEKNKAKYNDFNITTPEELLEYLKEQPSDNKEVQNLLKAYETEQAGKNPKTLKEQAADKKQSEYTDEFNKEGTIYEKTSNVLNKYLNENDSNYSALKSEKERQKYRDDLIASYRTKRGMKKDMTSSQREFMLTEFAEFVADAGVKGDKINSTKNNKTEINLDKIELNNRVDNLPMHKLNDIFKEIVSDPSKTSGQQLNEIMDKILSQTDTKYKNLKTVKEKQAYIENKSTEYAQKIFGIDPKILKENKETFNKLILTAFEQIKQNPNLDVTKLMSDTKVQQKFIAKLADSINLDEIKTNDPKVKKTMKMFQAKAKVYNLIKKDGSITERDIANKLKLMNKNGKLNTPELKELYEYYTNLEKIDKVGALNEEANMTSLVSKSLLVNKTPDEYIEKLFSGLNEKEFNEKLNDPEFINSFSSPAERKILRNFLLKHYGSSEAADKQMAKIFKDKLGIIQTENYAAKDVNSIASIENGTAANIKENENFLSTKQLAEMQQITENSSKILNVGEMKKVTAAQSNEAFALFGESRIRGINKNYNTADRTEYRNYMAISPDISSEKKSLSTKFFIKTGSAEQQLSDAKYYSTIKDSSVTEGLAAAEKYVDKSVKTQYSSYVDNAIKNNGYSLQEINTINTARKTGQTSYEYETSKASTSEKTTESNKSTNSSAEQKAYSTPSLSKTTSNTPFKTNISRSIELSNNQLYKDYRDITAQMMVADSKKKRDEAADKAQKIIENIQNDTAARAQRKAELAKKQAAAEEEIKAAAQEAKVKSEQQSKQDRINVAQSSANGAIAYAKAHGVDIPAETINKIATAARNGNLDVVYDELGKISATYQEKFIQILSKQNLSTIISFLRDKGTDKAVIRQLCRLNPALIKTLPSTMLADLNLEKRDIIMYSDSQQLKFMLSDLQQRGNREALSQFINALGDDASQYTTAQNSDTTDINPSDLPGGDNWRYKNNQQAPQIASLGNVVSNHSFNDGKTRKKLNPRDFVYWG